MASDEVREWIRNAPDQVKDWLGSIDVVRFLVDQRNKAFQMQGAYDGAMSEECKSMFAGDYETISAILSEVG